MLVTTLVIVEVLEHGGGVKVGQGLQSGKHLQRCQYTLIDLQQPRVDTYPPYIWPHSLTPSQQTDMLVLQLLVEVGSVVTEVVVEHGGAVKVGHGLQSL